MRTWSLRRSAIYCSTRQTNRPQTLQVIHALAKVLFYVSYKWTVVNSRREIRENFYNYEKEMESENRDDATAVREERSVSAPFQDPFAEEWAKYERDGGITMKLSEDITCLATEWDRIRLLSKLRSSCGSS